MTNHETNHIQVLESQLKDAKMVAEMNERDLEVARIRLNKSLLRVSMIEKALRLEKNISETSQHI